MSARTLRWGVVGTGTISRQMTADLSLLPDADVVAVSSRSAQSANAFADGFAIPNRFEDYSRMLDSDVEAVYIGTPHVTHFALAGEALTRGKHVLVEKPLGVNASEVRELVGIAKTSGTFLMEAMWMKFSPLHRRLRQIIHSGTIGDVRSVRASFGVPFPRDGSSRWHRGGSTLLDQGIYPVTLGYQYLGSPESVRAAGIVRPDGVDLQEHFTLEHSNGRFTHGAASMVDFLDLSAAISGTAGWITIDPGFWFSSRLTVHAPTPAGEIATTVVQTQTEGYGYVPMLRAVTAAIRSGKREHPSHTLEDTVRTFDILDEIRRQIVTDTDTIPYAETG